MLFRSSPSLKLSSSLSLNPNKKISISKTNLLHLLLARQRSRSTGWWHQRDVGRLSKVGTILLRLLLAHWRSQSTG